MIGLGVACTVTAGVIIGLVVRIHHIERQQYTADSAEYRCLEREWKRISSVQEPQITGWIIDARVFCHRCVSEVPLGHYTPILSSCNWPYELRCQSCGRQVKRSITRHTAIA